MTRVAIVADTHVPSRAEEIPDWVVDRAATADFLIHAGDFDSPDAFETVQAIGPPVTAVRGNMDPRDMGVADVETLDVEDVRFVVTHGSGSPRGWTDRVVETAREHDADGLRTVAVAGHIHEVVDEQVDGIRVLNPGSATGAPPATGATMMTVEVVGTDVSVTVDRE